MAESGQGREMRHLKEEVPKTLGVTGQSPALDIKKRTPLTDLLHGHFLPRINPK